MNKENEDKYLKTVKKAWLSGHYGSENNKIILAKKREVLKLNEDEILIAEKNTINSFNKTFGFIIDLVNDEINAKDIDKEEYKDYCDALNLSIEDQEDILAKYEKYSTDNIEEETVIEDSKNSLTEKSILPTNDKQKKSNMTPWIVFLVIYFIVLMFKLFDEPKRPAPIYDYINSKTKTEPDIIVEKPKRILNNYATEAEVEADFLNYSNIEMLQLRIVEDKLVKNLSSWSGGNYISDYITLQELNNNAIPLCKEVITLTKKIKIKTKEVNKVNNLYLEYRLRSLEYFKQLKEGIEKEDINIMNKANSIGINTVSIYDKYITEYNKLFKRFELIELDK